MLADKLSVSWLDRFLIGIAPDWGMRRVRARVSAQLMARHFEAAQGGRRTAGWQRTSTDANAANRPALMALRELSRDLRRNNGWARSGIETIVNNTVGWGIKPRPAGPRGRGKAALAIWNAWADTPACDFDGRMNFYGLQRLAMETIAEAGEVLIVRQPAAAVDGLPIPMRLQVLEPDYLDIHRNGLPAPGGGKIIDGVEFDEQGRRVAYWLFTSHPGSQRMMTTRFESVRTPADRVLHIYRVDRAGQVRGVPWLASAVTRIKDLDDFEDAELMQQKVAACFGAFVTEVDGAGTALGVAATDADGQDLDQLEPGHIAYLPPGKSISFATPPTVQDSAFTVRALRRIAVSLGVTYEDLTGDYSQVNFSSARMARLAHWANVHVWREHMLIPLLCGGVWKWSMDLLAELEGWPAAPAAQWSAPPMPILEPDKEGLAYQRLVRIGAMTWPQMVRELGEDPVAQLDEIERSNEEFDKRGIVLDIDARKMTVAGQLQLAAGPAAPGQPPKAAKPKPPTDDPAADDAADVAVADPAEEPPPPAPPPPKNPEPSLSPEEPAKKKQSDETTSSKVFAYHQPFMKVKEIREGIGLAGDIEDNDLFANEFVAKHSGPPADASGDKPKPT